MKVGFAETDITPPLGTHKIGWLKDIVGDHVLDPLYARAAVFGSAEDRIGFVQLDTLCVRWTQTNDIRARVQERTGVPGERIMVVASHNHAGPAVANLGKAPRDEQYIERLVAACADVFTEAASRAVEAEVGFQHVFDFGVASNRRVVMRDGTVRTHGTFADRGALCVEGPIDPEVAVLAARSPGGELLGSIVNYACHPTDHGAGTAFSAGYPGVLAREMKKTGCPVTLFLNGPCGNVHPSDPRVGGGPEMAEIGCMLAADARRAFGDMPFAPEHALGAASATVALPYREPSDAQVRGEAVGAQRFADPAVYDDGMPTLVERIRTRGEQPAEVQALSVGDAVFVSIPAEYFVEFGLRIKERSHPRHALIVSHANGMVGYVPTRDAFARGGYETTFAAWSRMAPEAGDMLADAAVAVVRGEARQ